MAGTAYLTGCMFSPVCNRDPGFRFDGEIACKSSAFGVFFGETVQVKG